MIGFDVCKYVANRNNLICSVVALFACCFICFVVRYVHQVLIADLKNF